LSFNTVNAVLAESTEQLFAKPAGTIDLDLGAVNRVDSAGLALLLEWMRIARSSNMEIRYHHLPEQLLAIARAGELDTLLPVTE
jgi:phospholipid transport system transporter-binding protein